MKHSLKIGVFFGLTSGTITTLGLMMGLQSGTHSKLAVVGGILTIAIADAFSDALGIHISEESEGKHTGGEIWQSTISTFFVKFIFPLVFIFPVLFFELSMAVVINIIWGLFILTLLSFKIAKEQQIKSWKVVSEHLTIALIVIVVTHFVGDWIALRWK